MEQWQDNEKKLKMIAQEDPIFLLWENAWTACSQAFADFANAQPDEIKNVLWGYADAGRMMQQRKVNLACTYMRFTEDQ